MVKFRWFKQKRENKISSRKVARKDESSQNILEEIFHREQTCERFEKGKLTMRAHAFVNMRIWTSAQENELARAAKCVTLLQSMLELDTLINNYLNANMSTMDQDKVKLMYNLACIDTTNLQKLFYFYAKGNKYNVEILSQFLKNKDEKEIQDTFKLLNDILKTSCMGIHDVGKRSL
ncbi:conserved Plasmodium protein, unknown function [Plasmodium ovale curtisi]|uniref:Uncharacterized protein n=1 Tax=Plasmodium ovale curtisi TaxID=864141 RepID=A0A1A8VIU7_PLAOA|nr:conserved Plasmodium protein, unknown function [Plasmodium ovale curtisi]SBS80773.1 conserved Plasmodium protein, unknown function [Plasmodium ovale curtisi]